MNILKIKNILFSLLTIMAVAISLTSCEQESNIIGLETETLEKQSLFFVHGDKTYEVSLDKDGNLDLSELSEELQQLINNSKHIVELDDDNILYLFGDKDVGEAFVSNAVESTPLENESIENRGTSTLRYYEHSNFGGGYRSATNTFNISNLSNSPYYFNDKISSCKIWNYDSRTYVVRFYQHKDYGGSQYTLVVSANTIKSNSNFNSVSFGDKASSIRGYYP